MLAVFGPAPTQLGDGDRLEACRGRCAVFELGVHLSRRSVVTGPHLPSTAVLVVPQIPHLAPQVT